MLQINPSWQIKVKRFCQRYSRHSWLAVAAFVASIILLVLQHYLLAFYALVLIVQCLTIHKNQDKHLPAFVPNILAELKLQQDMLHVKHRLLPVSKVRKVALNQIDDKEAMIDFPFNVYRKLAMRFPVSQLPELQEWFKQHLPTVQIID